MLKEIIIVIIHANRIKLVIE